MRIGVRCASQSPLKFNTQSPMKNENSSSDDRVQNLAEAIADRLSDEIMDELDSSTRHPENEKTLLDVNEVAVLLQVSPPEVKKIAKKKGGLEMVWVGDKRRFTRDAVEAFIESGGEFLDGWDW